MGIEIDFNLLYQIEKLAWRRMRSPNRCPLSR